MTQSKKMRRPALAGSGRRLSRELVDDLLAFFRGENSCAWSLLLPVERVECFSEICRRWREHQSEHPGAALPALLAQLMMERWRAHSAAHPDALPPDDLEQVRAAAAGEGERA